MEINHILCQHSLNGAGGSNGDCELESPSQTPVQLMALSLRQSEHLVKLGEKPASPAVRLASVSK